ncbi:hypothetical protein FRC17_000799 [Serendipita sp. 399]|nr:hypothetical protein FRC17_000799 [Serendipita sp. 399]
MTPPAALVIGSVVVVAGATFAFHHFVYEPHIAPKIEVFVENWLHERRLRRRRLAPGVRIAENGERPRVLEVPPTSEATEMETLTKSVKASGVERFVLDVPYERRKKPSGTHEPTVLEAPNPFIPIHALVPDPSIAEPGGSNNAVYSITSTPSTFSSSLSGLHSPTSQHDSPTAVDADHSRINGEGPLADSVLSESHMFSITSPSPTQSITHISPRPLIITLPSFHEPESPQTFDARQGSRRRDTVTLAPPVPTTHQREEQTLISPAGSSVYESAIADSPFSQFPPSSPRGISTPLSGERVSGSETPKSNASWSDLASANGDDGQFLIGSDDESWANISERKA